MVIVLLEFYPQNPTNSLESQTGQPYNLKTLEITINKLNSFT